MRNSISKTWFLVTVLMVESPMRPFSGAGKTEIFGKLKFGHQGHFWVCLYIENPLIFHGFSPPLVDFLWISQFTMDFPWIFPSKLPTKPVEPGPDDRTRFLFAAGRQEEWTRRIGAMPMPPWWGPTVPPSSARSFGIPCPRRCSSCLIAVGMIFQWQWTWWLIGVLMGFNGIEHNDLMDYEWDIPFGQYT